MWLQGCRRLKESQRSEILKVMRVKAFVVGEKRLVLKDDETTVHNRRASEQGHSVFTMHRVGGGA